MLSFLLLKFTMRLCCEKKKTLLVLISFNFTNYLKYKLKVLQHFLKINTSYYRLSFYADSLKEMFLRD